MKYRHYLLFTAALLIGLSVSIVAAGAVNYEQLLTPADLTKVSGLQGIKLVPQDTSKGAGGNLNFARPDGQLVLMVLFYKPDKYPKLKAQKLNYYGPVKGIGDDAFEGPSMGERNVLFCLKGKYCFSLSTYFDPKTMKAILSQEQMRQLAKVLISRLK